MESGSSRGLDAVENIHAPPTTRAIADAAGPERVAREYEAELRAAGLTISDGGFPIVDVMLLGIGDDGHILSVFPGSALFDVPDWVSAVPAPTHIEPHVARISLNPAIVAAARSVIVVVHGAGKAEILASVLGPDRDERRWPAQLARRPGQRGSSTGPLRPRCRADALHPRHDQGRAPLMPPTGPFGANPTLYRSPVDGTEIAVFEALARQEPAPGPPPLLLVHGATADHTTWRGVAPAFARSRRVYALDRRGRGASSDGPAYTIEREYEDVAAVAAAIAAPAGGRVDVAGHSYGGRVALGASLRTAAIRRLVVYEGAPVPPGMSYRPPGLVEAVRAALNRGDNEAALTTFLGGIVGMSEAELDQYRAHPVWPARVAAAHTILREVEAEAGPPASLDALSSVTAPVLLLLGSVSRSPFRIGTEALAARLGDVRSRRDRGRRPRRAPHARRAVRFRRRSLPGRALTPVRCPAGYPRIGGGPC